MSEGNGQTQSSAETAEAAIAEEKDTLAVQEAVTIASERGGFPAALEVARKIDPSRVRRAVVATIPAEWREGFAISSIPDRAWPYLLAWASRMFAWGYERCAADVLAARAPQPEAMAETRSK
jgi:hypothetical protein